MKKDYTEEEIYDYCAKIQALIDEGWSLQVSRRRILGTHGNHRSKVVMQHPSYMIILNDFMEKVGFNYFYYRVDGKLRSRRRDVGTMAAPENSDR